MSLQTSASRETLTRSGQSCLLNQFRMRKLIGNGVARLQFFSYYLGLYKDSKAQLPSNQRLEEQPGLGNQ